MTKKRECVRCGKQIRDGNPRSRVCWRCVTAVEEARRTLRAAHRVSRQMAADVAVRTSGCCAMCGEQTDGRTVWAHVYGVPFPRRGPRNPHIDHIVPVHLGGTTDPSNLRLACAECNLKKGHRNG